MKARSIVIALTESETTRLPLRPGRADMVAVFKRCCRKQPDFSKSFHPSVAEMPVCLCFVKHNTQRGCFIAQRDHHACCPFSCSVIIKNIFCTSVLILLSCLLSAYPLSISFAIIELKLFSWQCQAPFWARASYVPISVPPHNDHPKVYANVCLHTRECSPRMRSGWRAGEETTQ